MTVIFKSKQTVFTFLAAFLAIAGVFFTIHSIRDGRQAHAFSPLLSGKMVSGGVHYSAYQRRIVRRELSRDMDSIFALNGQDIRAVFMQPELVRRDAPTVIWQYRSEACVLDLYFSSASVGADLGAVAHYELRARKVGAFEEVEVEDCISDLVES